MADPTPEDREKGEKVAEAIRTLEEGGDEALDLRVEEIREYGEKAVVLADSLDLVGAVERLKEIEIFSSEIDYYRQLLWAAFTHAHDLFSAKWDLAFAGPKSAGKTRLTVYSTRLANKGLFLTDTTPASLTEVLDRGFVLGFDEADALLRAHRNDLVEAILRSGSAEEAQRTLKVKVEVEGADGKKTSTWELDFQSLGGPKTYNFHGKVDGALLSRADVVHVSPAKVRGLVNRRMVYRRYLDPVALWLRREARRRCQGWTAERMEALLLSESFIDEVEALPAALPRYSEIGLLQLATAKLMGWELSDAVRSTVKVMGAFEDDELAAEVQEGLVDLLGKYDHGGDRVEMELVSLTNLLNAARKARGERNVYRNALAEVLRDFGFVEGETKVKNPRSRRVMLILAGNVLRDLRVLRQSPEAPEAPEARGEAPEMGVLRQSGEAPEAHEAHIIGERVLARLLKRNVRGECEFCRTNGEDLLLVGPRGSSNMKKVCPPCAEAKFDLGPPPEASKGV